MVGRHPLVLVDGAHNAAGMMVLARSLVEEFTTEGETTAVVGMLTGRDPTAMLDALVSAGVRSVVACAPGLAPGACRWATSPRPPSSLGMEVALAASPAEAVRRGRRAVGAARTGWSCAARSTSWPTPGRALPGPGSGAP